MFRLRALLTRCRSYSTNIKADEYGIPVSPTWSVTKLLSSYPRPTVSSQTLVRLHELAALVPPAEGTPEHTHLREEISELVRLVKAVKLVDTQGVATATRWGKEDADRRNTEFPAEAAPGGQELLKHAARAQEGFYLVDADRQGKTS